MYRGNEFINLLDLGISIISRFIEQEKYKIYKERYKKIIKNLEDLKSATQEGTLFQNFIYLEVVKMIDQNDPEEIEDVLLRINKFYCDNYRKDN